MTAEEFVENVVTCVGIRMGQFVSGQTNDENIELKLDVYKENIGPDESIEYGVSSLLKRFYYDKTLTGNSNAEELKKIYTDRGYQHLDSYELGSATISMVSKEFYKLKPLLKIV